MYYGCIILRIQWLSFSLTRYAYKNVHIRVCLTTHYMYGFFPIFQNVCHFTSLCENSRWSCSLHMLKWMSFILLNFLSWMLFHAICLVVNCGSPGTSPNGQRTGSSTTYNSVVTYTCNTGYTWKGSNSRTCQSNGQWSGSVPGCNHKF